MGYTADNASPLGPRWDIVFPLVFGKQQPGGFAVEGVGGTAFGGRRGRRRVLCSLFGGLGEWDYTLAKVEPEGRPIALLRDIWQHPDGFDLAMGAFSAIVPRLRGNVTQDAIVTGLGRYGALPFVELDR
jgi:hypothetical protein